MWGYKSKIKPWPHQKYALKRLWKMKSALLWADVGTGKTKVAVDYALAQHHRGRVRKVLIVCPLAAVGVWKNEFLKHDPNVKVLTRNDVESLDGLVPLTHDVRIWAEKGQGLGVVVVTYEALSRFVRLFADSYAPDLLILDESHYIKSYSAIRTRRALAVARVAPYRLLLSGTPAPNGYIDFYWQVKAVHPSILPPTIKKFREEYCNMGGYMGKEIVGYKNTKKLAKELSKVVIRIPKSVMKLPPVIDQVVPVKLDKSTRTVYEALKKDLVVNLASGHTIRASNQLVLLLKLMQTTNGMVEGKRLGSEKLRVLQELIQNEPGKVVVFCHFVQDISRICEMLSNVGISHAVLRGGKSGAERDRIIHAFQTQHDPKVLVAQMKAGGIAVTLTAASVAIFYSLTFDAEAYEQARGRIHRGGQTETCRYIHLIAENTVDEAIYEALHKKMKTQEVLGNIVRRLTS